jgi:hypothetical protein
MDDSLSRCIERFDLAMLEAQRAWEGIREHLKGGNGKNPANYTDAEFEAWKESQVKKKK